MDRFREARPADHAAVARLMGSYYVEDGYPFSETEALETMRTFTGDPTLGRLWVAEIDGRVVGYLSVTLGYSFEYGGRDAFIDEVYIDAAHRGRGLGRQALALALDYCASRDVKAVHLEVEHHRGDAQRLYETMGFEAHDRVLMTRLLMSAATATDQP